MNDFIISEMDINAYIDGCLDPEKKYWIEALIASDRNLARQILELKNLKALMRNAYRFVAPPSSRVPVTSRFVAIARRWRWRV